MNIANKGFSFNQLLDVIIILKQEFAWRTSISIYKISVTFVIAKIILLKNSTDLII